MPTTTPQIRMRGGRRTGCNSALTYSSSSSDNENREILTADSISLNPRDYLQDTTMEQEEEEWDSAQKEEDANARR